MRSATSGHRQPCCLFYYRLHVELISCEQERRKVAMANFRFLSSIFFSTLFADVVKVLALISASLAAWYLGYIFAAIVPDDSLEMAVDRFQQVGLKPVLKAPVPKKQKCGVWTACSANELAYRIRSGGGKTFQPEICLDDQLLLGEATKKRGDRGINIVVVNRGTWKVEEIKVFDMYDGDYSGPMIEFLNKVPQGCLIMISSYDDASTKLSEDAKKTFEALGSKEVRNIKFRSAWVFIAIKGGHLTDNIEKEKINHSQQAKNRYDGWPAEIQIDGCIPKN
ncbi:protein FAM3B [Pelodytes ibericus]